MVIYPVNSVTQRCTTGTKSTNNYWGQRAVGNKPYDDALITLSRRRGGGGRGVEIGGRVAILPDALCHWLKPRQALAVHVCLLGSYFTFSWPGARFWKVPVAFRARAIFWNQNLRNVAPPYLCQKFKTRSEVHNCNTRNRDPLHIPLCRTAAGQRAFTFRGQRLWNSLPDEFQSITNLDVFKVKIKQHFLRVFLEN